MYLDGATNQCKIVEIQNCAFYDTDGKCTQCNDLYFVSEGKCVWVT